MMEVRSGQSLAPRLVAVSALTLICAAIWAMPAGAAFPGANGRIAYVNHVQYGGYQIFSMAPDGSDVRQLTSFKDADARNPGWSPDGSSLVFTKQPHGKAFPSIWVMDADGTNEQQLVGDKRFRYIAPSYSPDGSTIVFGRCKPEFRACDLETADADGGNVQHLTPFAAGVYDFRPCFSPDGTQIAFIGFNRDGVKVATYVMNSDGSGIERVTPIRLQAQDPDWAPDGSTLVVDAKKGPLYQVNPDGTGLLRLTDPKPLIDFDPAYSPAGDAIVFSLYQPDGRHSAIWVVAADGSGGTRLARRGFQPAWGSAP
jgi:Tol biopolymer transport system component